MEQLQLSITFVLLDHQSTLIPYITVWGPLMFLMYV